MIRRLTPSFNTLSGANWVSSVLRTAKLDAKGKTTKTSVSDGSATASTGALSTAAKAPVTTASAGTDATSVSTTGAASSSSSDSSLRQGYTRKGVLHGKHGSIAQGMAAPLERPTPSKQANPYLGLGDGGDSSSSSKSIDLSEQPRKRVPPGVGLPEDSTGKPPLPPVKHLPIDTERRNYKAPQIHEEHSFSGKKRSSSKFVDQEGNQVDSKLMKYAKKEESFGLTDPSSVSPRSKRTSSARTTGKARGEGEYTSGDAGDKQVKSSDSLDASGSSDSSIKSKKKSTARPDYIKLGGVDGLPVQYLRVTPKKKKGAEEGAAGGASSTTSSSSRRRLEEEATTATAPTSTASEASTTSTTTAVAAATPANIEASSSSSSATAPAPTSNDIANANSGMIVDPVPIPTDQGTTSNANSNSPNQKRRQPGGTPNNAPYQHAHSTNTPYQHTRWIHSTITPYHVTLTRSIFY